MFFEPYRAHFHDRLGRPSVPIETYLRLMFSKYRYRLGFGLTLVSRNKALSGYHVPLLLA